MLGKTRFIAAVGLGYVLGSRAGRGRYEQIKKAASKIRNSSLVAQPLDKASDRVKESVQRGGQQLTDQVAQMVKDRIFGTRTHRPAKDQYVDVEIIEETETR